MVQSAVLGFPRIGAFREIKKSTEAYWAGKITAEALEQSAKEMRLQNASKLKERGVDFIPSGDFSLYDHMLETIMYLGAAPSRFTRHQLSDLDTLFAMGRGRQTGGVDEPAMEMKKWFNSNYHIVVPEFSESSTFKYRTKKILNDFQEAKDAGIITRPVILGPVSFLALGKVSRDATSPDFDCMTLLGKLVPVYAEILKDLKAAGATDVQIDEPILVLDQSSSYGPYFKEAYSVLATAGPAVMLTTYFGRLESTIDFIKDLPIAGLHVDLTAEPKQLQSILSGLKSTQIKLSLGLVSGRNIWKTDINAMLNVAKSAIAELGTERVIVATASSLLHTPITIANESKLSADVKDWFAFALEKSEEVVLLAKAASGTLTSEQEQSLKANADSIAKRKQFEKTSDANVRERIANIKQSDFNRSAPYEERRAIQEKELNLPRFPTTTIGSFPQTAEIRKARALFNKGDLSSEDYDSFIAKEIQHAVEFQERIGLDLLVHGESERSDMSLYFGERLEGFAFTQNGWVQSYGTRCVRPPIIVSDISREAPMTVKWSAYAQKISKKPMKGMLTGPVTILAWSFPREDVDRKVQSLQLALALRDEVLDLEAAGIKAIQVDEPAIRESLPLRASDQADYFDYAVNSFRLAVAGVQPGTQTHSHFCYSEFNDSSFERSIAQLDADVISIEASKSDLKLLSVFQRHAYSAAIGPGVYDIHSPRVPSVEELKGRIAAYLKDNLISKDMLVVNPDCGLKTRGWKETEEALVNMVEAAKWARQTYQ